MLAAGMALTMVFTVLQAFSIGGITTVPFLAFAAFGRSWAWPNVSALISPVHGLGSSGTISGTEQRRP